MRFFAAVLNLPWTVIGLLVAFFSFPKELTINDGVIRVKVQRVWIAEPFYGKKLKGFTMGNMVLKTAISQPNTLDHELVHIEQFAKYPLIFPLIYVFEYLSKGKRNRYEKEAYKN